MTRDEMDIFRSIAKSLERIADHITGQHIEEKSLSELCETCYYNKFPDICWEREFNMMRNGAGICYAKDRTYVQGGEDDYD